MIIPVSPVPVRIALETQGITNNGYVVPDIDVNELIEKADSAQYELQICYGTTSLYRSILYQVNKTAKTITFFFMVGNDLYSAALTASNGRCTFKKIPFGDTLPTVTSAYEGYVLTVNELGEWVAAEASGGANVLTLYANTLQGHLYTDSACTDQFLATDFDSYNDAYSYLQRFDAVKVIYAQGGEYHTMFVVDIYFEPVEDSLYLYAYNKSTSCHWNM